MLAEHTKESPDVVSCPPLVFFGAMGLGLLLNWWLPLRSFASFPSHLAGGIMGLAGTSLGLWGVRAMHRVGTSVRPGLPVTALATDGPFRYTRNPLYLALTIIYFGIILSSGMLWPVLTLIPALAIVHWKIVRREEQFLEGRFGEGYRAYKVRVPRWL